MAGAPYRGHRQGGRTESGGAIGVPRCIIGVHGTARALLKGRGRQEFSSHDRYQGENLMLSASESKFVAPRMLACAVVAIIAAAPAAWAQNSQRPDEGTGAPIPSMDSSTPGNGYTAAPPPPARTRQHGATHGTRSHNESAGHVKPERGPGGAGGSGAAGATGAGNGGSPGSTGTGGGGADSAGSSGY